MGGSCQRKQPGASIAPLPLYGSLGKIQRAGDLGFIEARVESERHISARSGEAAFSSVGASSNWSRISSFTGDFHLVQVHAFGVSAVSRSQSTPGSINQYLTHCLCRGAEEMRRSREFTELPLPFALVWRKDNGSPLLARFFQDVRSLPEVEGDSKR